MGSHHPNGKSILRHPPPALAVRSASPSTTKKIAGIRALIRSSCPINEHREMSPSLAAKTEVHGHLIVR